MKRKRIQNKREHRLPVAILFMAGFLAGTILPNVVWKLQWKQSTISSLYLLGTFADSSIAGKEYLLEVLKRRGSFFLLYALCGYSVFGVLLAVAGTLGMGLVTGLLLTIPVLEFGLWGGAIGLGLLFPQELLYLPVSLYLMARMYEQSVDIWKNRGMFPEKSGRYGICICACAVFYLGGIFLETYINPHVVEMLIGFSKIF